MGTNPSYSHVRLNWRTFYNNLLISPVNLRSDRVLTQNTIITKNKRQKSLSSRESSVALSKGWRKTWSRMVGGGRGTNPPQVGLKVQWPGGPWKRRRLGSGTGPVLDVVWPGRGGGRHRLRTGIGNCRVHSGRMSVYVLHMYAVVVGVRVYVVAVAVVVVVVVGGRPRRDLGRIPGDDYGSHVRRS